MTMSNQPLVLKKSEIERILQRYLEKSTLETTFDWCTKNVLIPEPPSPSTLQDALHVLFSNNNSEQWSRFILDYANYMIAQANPHRVLTLTHTLEALVSQNIIPARMVCETVLQQLDIENQLTWQHGLSLVHSVVGGVDYKGCREIMKLILDRFDKLPRSIPEKHISSLHAIRKVLAYMLDRNAALLPAYIAHDEIQLRYSNPEQHPHWALRDITSTLNGSMEVLAHLVSGNMLSHLIPMVGGSSMSGSAWKLDPVKTSVVLPGRLPYPETLQAPCKELIYKVLAQQASKDYVISMLSLNKQPRPHPLLEECMSRLILEAMKVTEEWKNEEAVLLTWSHLANQFSVLALIQVINSTKILNDVNDQLSGCNLPRGRCFLMWLLLHFLSGNVTNKEGNISQEESNVVCTIINTLYADESVPLMHYSLQNKATYPLPVPDTSSSQCVYEFAAACLWNLLSKKAQSGNLQLHSEPPRALNKHLLFIQEQMDSLLSTPVYCPPCYIIAVLLNAFCLINESNNAIYSTLLGSSLTGSDWDDWVSPHPLPMSCVNWIVSYAKAKMSDKIKVQMMRAADSSVKQSQGADSQLVTPALLETFSRVLLWSGTKNFQSQLIPVVFKMQDWTMLQSLLEMISYRFHYQLQIQFRFQILILLHSIAGVSIIPMQLFICAEDTALHLLLGLVSNELPFQLIKSPTDPKQLFYTDSDELNKVLLLVLAQSICISRVDLGSWLENLFKDLERIHSNSIFLWPESSLAFLPAPIRQHCQCPATLPSAQQSHQTLISRVEEEYQKLTSMAEMELQQLYSEGDSSLYIFCVMWKQLLVSSQVTPLVARLLQRLRLSPKKQTSLLRTLIDYVVYTCPQPASSSNPQFMSVAKCLNNLVWKYFLYPLDRLLLCLLWRSYGGKDAVVSINLVYQLLMMEELTNRITDFINTVPFEVWNESNWGEKHNCYLSSYPECFTFDTSGTGTVSSPVTIFFGNVCLRILPVLDVTIQRMVEAPDLYQPLLVKLLDKYKDLYKYHDHPVYFLYILLHYYSNSLIDHPQLKYHIVSTILGSIPQDWLTNHMCFSLLFQKYIIGKSSDPWKPTPEYWNSLLSQLIKVLIPLTPLYPHMSWPLNEFASPVCSLLITSALEVMSLPYSAAVTLKHFVDAIVAIVSSSHCEDKLSIFNVAGALLSVLPDTYTSVLYDDITSTLQSPPFTIPISSSQSYLDLFAISTRPGCLLNLGHAFLHHSNITATSGLLIWLQVKLKPILNNELQVLYLCHFLGPIMNRLASEKPTLLLQLVIELYQFIYKVDQVQEGLIQNCDPICDLLYHIKYMHIGDFKKDEIEKIVTSLHSPLKMRLRCLVHSVGSSSVDSRPLGAVTPVMSVAPGLPMPNVEPMQT